MKASHTIWPVFDDPNLVSAAGLVPALRLAESARLHDLLEEQLSVASPNATAKATSMVGGMLVGADSIDDLDLLPILPPKGVLVLRHAHTATFIGASGDSG